MIFNKKLLVCVLLASATTVAEARRDQVYDRRQLSPQERRQLSLKAMGDSGLRSRSLQPGAGGPGGGPTSPCPDTGIYSGSISAFPTAAPLLGNVACVDNPTNTTNERDEFIEFAKDIYGPMEDGLDACNGETVPGGVDTATAQSIIQFSCNNADLELLNACGGHANFHYHEDMSCLYTEDLSSGHSTKFATALDGNGIYGRFIDGGVEPTDLDACGGRTGITPDSGGAEVYYYVMQDRAPFTIGCFGPVSSVQECRDLYDDCENGDEQELTLQDGSVLIFDTWCPCFDSDGFNIDQDTVVDLGNPAATTTANVVGALALGLFVGRL